MTTTDVDLFLSDSLQPRAGVARLRDRLEHPVIDGDGHLLEFHPWVLDIAKEIAGTECRKATQRCFRFGTTPREWGRLPAPNFFDGTALAGWSPVSP